MDEKQVRITEVEARIILALSENEMRLKASADAVHYTRSNVEYHIKRIRTVTGLNPRDFYDLSKLIPMAKTVLEGGWEWCAADYPDRAIRHGWRCGYCKTSLADIVGGNWDEPTAKPELKFCPECGKDMRGKDNG
jgi:hypothetical protein